MIGRAARYFPLALTASIVLLAGLITPSTALGFTPNRNAPLLEQVNDRALQGIHLSVNGWPLAPPIQVLDQMAPIVLSFDRIGNETPTYTYQIIHCDAHWHPSDLIPSDYIEGFPSNTLPFPAMSVATTTPFAHYELRIPNEDIRLKLSGNYALLLFRDDDDNNPILVRHFAICEQMAQTQLTVHRLPGDKRTTYQRLEVKVHTARLGGSHLLANDLTVVTRQNWYAGCQSTLAQPTSYEEPDVLQYGNAFTGLWLAGNEWRMLNIQSLHLAVDRIASIDQRDGSYQVELHPDGPRDAASYSGEADLNGYWADGYAGDWKITRGPNNYQPLESDYAWVYFSYRPPTSTVYEDSIYLQIANLGKDGAGVPMHFNPSRGQHEVSVRLKQGVYSYRYVLHRNAGIPSFSESSASGSSASPKTLSGTSCGDPCPTEGCYADTENEYNALVYYRPPSERYDRLVGWGRYAPVKQKQQLR